MKAKHFSKLLLLVLYLMIIFSFIGVDYGACYNNSSGRKGYTYAGKKGFDAIYTYYNGYYGSPIKTHSHTFDKEQAYFGTHDWIAESALLILYEKVSWLPYGQGFIYNMYSDASPYYLRMYFLLGTEAPDLKQYESQYPDLYEIVLKDCQDFPYGTNDLSYNTHIMNFDSNPINQNCALEAQYCWTIAVNAFFTGDCRKAAFFLGAMCHYISDAAAYPHHYTENDYSNLGGHRSAYFSRIAKLTYRVERYRGTQQSHGFFSIDYARGQFKPLLGEMGWFATYKGGEYVHSEKQWLWDKFEEHQFDWYEVNPAQTTDKLEHLCSWHRDKFASFTGEKAEYFNTIERHLNIAVLRCAYAINLALRFFEDCDCGHQPNPGLENIHKQMQAHANDHVVFLMLGTTSFISALFVIGLVFAESSKIVP